jgi:hypothetical protein
MQLSNDYILNNMVVDVWLNNDCEMTKIWITRWKLITKYLFYNDMGNVHHLPTYLPPTYHPTTCLLSTS